MARFRRPPIAVSIKASVLWANTFQPKNRHYELFQQILLLIQMLVVWALAEFNLDYLP